MDSSLLLVVVFAGLIVFMFVSSRRRVKKQKLELEEKARQTVPGAEVLLQGGLYGTIVEYDGEDLDKPAQVEIAPGVVIKVHSQAVLRIVDPASGTVTEDEFIEAEETEAEYVAGVADGDITSISDDHRAARQAAEADADRTDKDRPQA
ncbi:MULTISPECIES: preprotein translocase subunit YajC [Microbacterium]|jgi:preprotein translocase subunit YajC|uniref:preprotein translocase subunit YajC n=1 Tax=Microbacterium TaxID=33882 RepID=UPI0023DB8141|nr:MULTISPECIES: preprotein translocase subunit YajC [Microbacterium]MDF2045863.1 preprotein translocase subunit YajC [Microbacterium sp. Kw_RZR3]MDQ1076994.1 preprotein translocase subunit YajC [Microbacterium sp. SORGH_AS_0969]MDQ1117231.1 preprotein translocase subunit YajC [Microbacterium testaceum]